MERRTCQSEKREGRYICRKLETKKRKVTRGQKFSVERAEEESLHKHYQNKVECQTPRKTALAKKKKTRPVNGKRANVGEKEFYFAVLTLSKGVREEEA